MEKTSFLDVRLFAPLEVKASHLLQISAIKVRESRKPFIQGLPLRPQPPSWELELPGGQVGVACMIFLQTVFPSITGHFSLYARSITNDSASFPDQGGHTHNLTVSEITKAEQSSPHQNLLSTKRCLNKQQINIPGKEEPHGRGEHK